MPRARRPVDNAATRRVKLLTIAPTELIEQAIWHEQRRRCNVTCISRARSKAFVPASPVRLLVIQRFFRVVGFLKYPVKRMRDADTVFTGQRQNKLFLPAAQLAISTATALTGGFAAASYGPDDSTDDADGLCGVLQAISFYQTR